VYFNYPRIVLGSIVGDSGREIVSELHQENFSCCAIPEKDKDESSHISLTAPAILQQDYVPCGLCEINFRFGECALKREYT